MFCLEVLLPDAELLAECDQLLALLLRQQARHDPALAVQHSRHLITQKIFGAAKNIWRGESDLVAGEGVECLGGGLLQTREVLRLELGLGLLGERGPHPHPGGGGVGLHQSELGIVTRARNGSRILRVLLVSVPTCNRSLIYHNRRV